VQILSSARGHGGLAALHLAAGTGNEDMVATLIRHSAPLEAKCDDNWTPLASAYYAGEYRAVVSLLTAGSSTDIFDEDGRTFIELLKDELHQHWSLLQYLYDAHSTKITSISGIGKKLVYNIPLLKHALLMCGAKQSSVLDGNHVGMGPAIANTNGRSTSDGTSELKVLSKLKELLHENYFESKDDKRKRKRTRTCACLIRGIYLQPIYSISGWSNAKTDEVIAGRPWRDETFELARLIGHDLPSHGYDELGRPGSYYASHAEKKALTAFIATHTLALDNPRLHSEIPKFLRLSKCEPSLEGTEIEIYIGQELVGNSPASDYCEDCVNVIVGETGQ
jgi:hypothetical protein